MSTHPDIARTTRPTVRILICYFGKFPGWMKVFLLGCAHNPTIDFVIFTDQEEVQSAPQNVRFVHLLPSAFEQLASEKMGTTVPLSRALKLGDYKPLYGLIFEEYLDGWDYWGYTDVDVIFGDLRRFLTTSNLAAYDVFTTRKEYLVGHFTLYRNNEYTRRLFQQSADIPALLRSDRLFSFDECGRQWARLLQGLPLNSKATCDSMTHVVSRNVADGTLTAHFSRLVIESPELTIGPWQLRWRNGRLWLVEEHREYMYFHFHFFKRSIGYRRPRVMDGDEALEMSMYGITGCIVEHFA